jgi:hypothetical protein
MTGRWTANSPRSDTRHPYFVQLYGDAVWQAAAPDPGVVLGREHLLRAQSIVDVDTQAMFRARWAKATPGEQRLMTAMSRLGDEPVRRADLADHLGVNGEHLGVQRRRLIDKGLIESAGHGRLRSTKPPARDLAGPGFSLDIGIRPHAGGETRCRRSADR